MTTTYQPNDNHMVANPTTIRVKGWSKWQSLRKDRQSSPWIKLHKELLTNAKWAHLTDAEKGQLISIWMVVDCSNGEVTADERILRKICMLDEAPNLQRLADIGFIEFVYKDNDVNQLATICQPSDNQEVKPTTTERRGEESREEKSIKTLVEQDSTDVVGDKKKTPSKTSAEKNIACKAIDHLNEVTGKSFRHADTSLKHVIARIKEGHSLEDICAVVDRKFKQWDGTEWAQYLRPSTLFNAEKFNDYVGELGQPLPERKDKQDNHNGFDKVDYASGASTPEEVEAAFGGSA